MKADKKKYQFDNYEVYAPKNINPDLVRTAYDTIKVRRALIWDMTFKGRYINYTITQVIDEVEYWIEYYLDLKTRNIIFTDISCRN